MPEVQSPSGARARLAETCGFEPFARLKIEHHMNKRISTRLVSRRSRVNEAQAKLLAASVRNLEGAFLIEFSSGPYDPDNGDTERFWGLPEYQFFCDAAYACGFVCTDSSRVTPLACPARGGISVHAHRKHLLSHRGTRTGRPAQRRRGPRLCLRPCVNRTQRRRAAALRRHLRLPPYFRYSLCHFSNSSMRMI